MAWYSKYLVAFEHSYSDVPEHVKQEVKAKLAQKKCDKNPLASVVLIAHNEEKRILACLWSLANNVCNFPIEIIVVSNNSTDATDFILDELNVKWFREEKKGPGFARQCGLDHALGKYYLCIDTDTLYPPHYIVTHIRNLQHEQVVCTFGLWSFLPDKKHSSWALYGYEFLRDIYLNLQNMKRPELCVRGMTLAFRTEFARKIGFNTNIIRGEDGTLALNLKQYGKICLLRSRKVRPITCSSTLDGGGNLWNNFKGRFKKSILNLGSLFSSKEHYEDREYNMIDKSKKIEV